MFKKLLTLAAVAAMASMANAESVKCYDHDWSTETSWNKYVMGYIPQVIDGELVAQAPMVEYVEIKDENAEKYADEGWDSWEVISINGTDNKIRPLETPAGWYQFFLENITGKKQMTHFLNVTCYAPELAEGEVAAITLQCRWSWSEDPINAVLEIDSTTPKEYTVVFDGPAADAFDVIYQASYQGPVHIKRVTCEYENIEIVQEMDDLAVNGDAETPWENPTMASDAEGWMNIVAWGKEAKGDPHPATIEAEGSNHVFVVHATAMESDPWDNQFWICAPRELATGDEMRISFKLKATAAANPGTQCHKNAGNYLHWAAIGNPQFTTEWTDFVNDFTVPSAGDGMSSIAFNLNDYTPANDYYVDDIKLEVAKIQEGWFIATDAIAKGLLGAAAEMTLDEDDCYTAIIGSAAAPASWFIISQAKGSDSAFKGASIYTADELADDEWYDFVAGTGKKMQLPEAGIWKVSVDVEASQLYVKQLSDADGIMSVANENAAPVYFNLQGVQVQNPNNGIFIVKKGNRVYKQVIR